MRRIKLRNGNDRTDSAACPSAATAFKPWRSANRKQTISVAAPTMEFWPLRVENERHFVRATILGERPFVPGERNVILEAFKPLGRVIFP